MRKKILLIDDHPLVSFGFRELFNDHDYTFIDACEQEDEIYDLILHEAPDYIIMDIYQQCSQKMNIPRVLNTLGNKDKIIIFTESDSIFYQKECMELGISAYLTKNMEPEAVLQAITALDKGEKYYPALAKRRKMGEVKKFDKYMVNSLTNRELLVLQMFSAGHSIKQISLILNLSNKTISTYKQRLLEKLGAKSVVEAVDIARLHEVHQHN